jgi:NTP pyrophosphatase (non-canonical NTP hydrolase)
MVTLTAVQNEINRQLVRDYGDRPYPDVSVMVHMGLVEEAGEVAGLMKRVLRNFPKDKERVSRENFIDEMGDVLWYLAACCRCHCTSLDEIWKHNIEKLEKRYGK